MLFEELPSEIVLEVLEGQDSIQVLHNVAQCSKWLYTLINPILYSAIPTIKTTSLLAFLRTIIQKPDLAPHVKTFAGSTRCNPEACTRSKSSVFSTDDAHRIQQIINSLPIYGYKAKVWCYDVVRRCKPEAITALLMLLLPNLDSLEVSSWSCPTASSMRIEKALRWSSEGENTALVGKPESMLLPSRRSTKREDVSPPYLRLACGSTCCSEDVEYELNLDLGPQHLAASNIINYH